jgi:2-keto-4-pentenoate hydratase/2-oxohepta-3-ene-1,7-dioic acid hydratase in catechol pathway
MKLCTFFAGDAIHIGVVTDDGVVDLSQAAPELPNGMCKLLAAGAPALRRAQTAAATAKARVPLEGLRLASPVPHPPKFLAIGLNYADHIAETGRDKPALPTVFNKQTSCVVGPHDAIHVPRASNKVDYEGELAFVIGRRCRHVPRERAHEVIAGYCVANDVTVRDWQIRVPTWTMGKSFDTHGPLGPWLTTSDEVGDPHGLRIRTHVSGELRQDSTTKHLIFDCYALVEHLSTAFTLEPGDVISTGTPSGVGVAMKPPKYLVPGDVVRIEIEGLGVIENPVIAEPENTVRI